MTCAEKIRRSLYMYDNSLCITEKNMFFPLVTPSHVPKNILCFTNAQYSLLNFQTTYKMTSELSVLA